MINYFKAIRLGNLHVFLFVFFSSFYLAKLTQLSPVYIVSIAAFWLFFIQACSVRKISFPLPSVICFLLFSYSQIIQLINYNSLSTYINLSLGLLAFIAVVAVRRWYDYDFWINSAKLYIGGVVVFCGLDSIYRILNPTAPSEKALEILSNSSEISFYLYKFGTLAFADSNTTALICLTAMLLCYYLMKAHAIKVTSLFFVATVIMLSCLSRSAIISAILTFLFFGLAYKWRIFLVLFSPVFLVFALGFISFNFSDGSLDSKFYILSKFDEYLTSASILSIIFGVGFDGSSAALDNIYAHILYVTLIVESGIVGFFLYFSFLISLLVYTNWKAGLIILPLAIASLSYFFYLGAPFFFVSLALLYNLSSYEADLDCKV
ncbi:hypothetical protein BWP24_15500 [Vibrio campbellii]|uniref:hypothetical protein n=1 Tax=Vibrio campbellii TaxID=680 RepID=UPI000971B85F|nr:hypothetical protein [Vibrio campbellii]APX07491.1 hypothetical protein BWP24_15500 [Vibrio campbellii]ARR07722.1 unknow [Vibrio campbellii]